ncbi:rust resistance kinase Lr10-like isoform X15 [Quercus robur]|uniref:rust resistance kinase Lr10-like isoform X14 n=1 Tax=Quercus robur TaxID=38942 RepID=UPI0021631173|nr:rust resistance kinase Lr10-like isoform X14 [Quercus robur]XP_050278658.1 rust resistance kinase Lr10-like isoform X15 [Quercus robur]
MASVSLFVLIFVLSHLVLLHSAEEGGKPENPYCLPFQCGKLGNISFPFTETPQPFPSCEMQVECDETHPMINFPLGDWRITRRYEVININHTNTAQHIRVKDHSLLEYLKTNKCESLDNFTIPHSPFISFKLTTPHWSLFKCYRPLQSTSDRNFKKMTCRDHYNFYYSPSNEASQSSPPGCLPILLPVDETSHEDELNLIAEFDLELQGSDYCSSCNGKEGEENKNNNKVVILLAISFAGTGVLMVIIYCSWRKLSSIKSINFWKKENVTHQRVKAFLRNHGPLAIRRYNYSNIKTMTKSFNDKLGQGGYGSVYKGKLQDGSFVAVKVLNNSKGNGEEFINEVATISRTFHVNIVTLKGFCFEGSKRALIYEFMPNGSLEKFIYKGNPSSSNHQLGWETLYKIAIGIARGLEYLHRGCNTRIFHFDIKPHNILLDEDFCPKISDFGLAKICPRENSIISMVGARGTTAYIAPEVFCRNFRGISHKSDVYSYGMMVLEMVGGRKNIDASVDFTSDIYFPHWIYKRLELNEELGLLGLFNEGDEDNARKMIIVSLWCIQIDPLNRPSMSRVVEMLEGSLNSLQIPPKPFLFSPPRSPTSLQL